MSTKHAITTLKEAGVPVVYDYSQDNAAGFEGTGRDDFAVPFLVMLQSNSPQAKKNDPQRIEGAEEGQIFNTVSKAARKAVVFVPAFTEHLFTEWVPRDDGGGFRGNHSPNSDVVVAAAERFEAARKAGKEVKFGKLTHPSNGNDLVETFYVWGIELDDEGLPTPGVIAFSSTQIKHYKNWVTRARNIRIKMPDNRLIEPPLFAHRYRLTSHGENNKDGSWSAWTIEFDGASAAEARLPPNDPIYSAAKQICLLAQKKELRADTAGLGGNAAVDEGGEKEMPY